MDLDKDELKETRKKKNLDNYIEKEKIRKILKEYAHTQLNEYWKIIEFYQKIRELVEE